jgi:hypothetical protein
MANIVIGGKPTEVNAPAEKKEIEETLNILGTGFPVIISDLWMQTNGISYNNVYLYSTLDIVERNETFEVGEYAPTMILIGDDGGGNGFFIKRNDEQAAVYKIDLGAIGSTDGTVVSSNFEGWLAGGVKQSTVDKLSENETEDDRLVTIFLVREPKEGLKGLLSIKSMLKLNISIADLKKSLDNLPFPLLENVYLIKYKKAIVELNNTQNCIFYN